MFCSFKAGDKVVYVGGIEDEYCVELFLFSGGIVPEVGKVYSVRDMWSNPATEHVGVYVDEIRNAPMHTALGLMELPYPAYLFRPVVEPGTETGMSILRDLLNTQDKPLEVVS